MCCLCSTAVFSCRIVATLLYIIIILSSFHNTAAEIVSQWCHCSTSIYSCHCSVGSSHCSEAVTAGKLLLSMSCQRCWVVTAVELWSFYCLYELPQLWSCHCPWAVTAVELSLLLSCLCCGAVTALKLSLSMSCHSCWVATAVELWQLTRILR